MNKSRIWGRAFFVVALLGVSLGAVAAPSEPADVGLFSEVAADGSSVDEPDVVDDPTVVRSRLVTVDFAQLGAPDAAGIAGSVADRLVLNFFADAVYTAVLDRVEISALGAFSWIGNLEGVELSQVILTVKDGVMVGNVVGPGLFYQVRYVGDGVHAIREVDQAAFPPEAEPIPVELPAGDLAQPDSTADDGSTIDVLVVYTDDARVQVGGTAAMEAMITQAETETNAGYANSNVAQRVNLVYTAEVSYDESGFDWNTTLSRFRAHGDGYFDSVTEPGTGLRDTYLADESVLIVKGDLHYCGMAYLMSSLSPSFESLAFAVVAYNCATGYYSFAHEMGHNMGAHHDRANASGPGAYSYSYGYQAPDEAFRTVMAYNCPGGCPRINYWSNPDVSYGGQPTGVDHTDPINSADNHLTLNNTAYTVANFRSNDPPYAPSAPWPADGATGQGIDVDLSWIGGDPDVGDTATFDVYFRESASTYTRICDGLTAPPCDPGALALNAHYHWYVVATDSYSESTTGPEWDFYTLTNDPPYTPGNPLPPDGTTGESIDVDLAWTGGDPDAGDAVTYTVYLDTSSPPGSTVCAGSATACDLGTLALGTSYYWRVVATDSFSEVTPGPTWGFTTGTATGPTIRGYVRDASGSGIGGVDVAFSGTLTVTTDSSGYYAQSGFSGTYTVTVGAAGYAFSPKEDLVTVGGEDVTHDVTGYAFAPTGLLFYDGFESATHRLGSAWAVETDYEGRAQISSAYPHQGSYSLLLDDDTDGGFTSHASAILSLDLSGETDVKLGFWWRAFKFESPLDDNGIFISDDYGETWTKVFTFTSPTEFSYALIDLDEEASNVGLTLNDHFMVKFQIYENWPIPTDGCAIDDVIVYSDRYNVHLPVVLNGWP